MSPVGRRSFFTTCNDAYLTVCSEMTRQIICHCDVFVIETQRGCILSGRCQMRKHPISEQTPGWCFLTPGRLLTIAQMLQEPIHIEDTSPHLLM